jgi:hypothetical protein
VSDFGADAASVLETPAHTTFILLTNSALDTVPEPEDSVFVGASLVGASDVLGKPPVSLDDAAGARP